MIDLSIEKWKKLQRTTFLQNFFLYSILRVTLTWSFQTLDSLNRMVKRKIFIDEPVENLCNNFKWMYHLSSVDEHRVTIFCLWWIVFFTRFIYFRGCSWNSSCNIKWEYYQFHFLVALLSNFFEFPTNKKDWDSRCNYVSFFQTTVHVRLLRKFTRISWRIESSEKLISAKRTCKRIQGTTMNWVPSIQSR